MRDAIQSAMGVVDDLGSAISSEQRRVLCLGLQQRWRRHDDSESESTASSETLTSETRSVDEEQAWEDNRRYYTTTTNYHTPSTGLLMYAVCAQAIIAVTHIYWTLFKFI